MTTDNVRNISDYRKKDDTANAELNVVEENVHPVKLSEKLRSSITPGLKQQMRQQMRNKHGI